MKDMSVSSITPLHNVDVFISRAPFHSTGNQQLPNTVSCPPMVRELDYSLVKCYTIDFYVKM